MNSLRGKRVLVTRPTDQNQEFVSLLEKVGAIPVIFPTIETKPIKSWHSLDDYLAHISQYDWLIFASSNALKYFMERARFIDPGLRRFQGIPICTVGTKTREQAEAAGLKVTLVPEIQTKDGILDSLGQKSLQGKRILVPCGNLSKAELAFGLMQKGARVDSVVVYETRTPQHHDVTRVVKLLFQGKITVLTFTSPSTFQNFMELFNQREFFIKTHSIFIAAIGETTARFIQKNGYPVHVVSKQPEMNDFILAIQEFLKTSLIHV